MDAPQIVVSVTHIYYSPYRGEVRKTEEDSTTNSYLNGKPLVKPSLPNG